MITILGPTACGKTQLAVAVAAQINGAVVSADSRQVYKGMDIGTGKDLHEYTSKGKRIDSYLIDICEPGEKYNVYQYQQDFLDIYNKVTAKHQPVVLCGGSGLYLEAVLRHYQMPDVPQNAELRAQLQGQSLQKLTDQLQKLKEKNGLQMHNTTDVDTVQRAIRAIEIEQYRLLNAESIQAFPHIDSIVVGVSIDREQRRKRITERLHQRLEHGMIEEVRHLLDTTCTPQQLIYYGLEYKYITEYLIGTLNYEEMVSQLEIAIHQFAKRQMTWFRGMERRGILIHWIDFDQTIEEKTDAILRLIQAQEAE